LVAGEVEDHCGKLKGGGYEREHRGVDELRIAEAEHIPGGAPQEVGAAADMVGLRASLGAAADAVELVLGPECPEQRDVVLRAAPQHGILRHLVDAVDGAEGCDRVGRRVDLDRHAFAATLPQVFAEIYRPGGGVGGGGVTVVEVSIAIFRGLGEDERGGPARGEVIGVVVFRVGDVPGSRLFHFGVGELGLRPSPLPNRPQDGGMRVRRHQALRAGAIGAVELAKARQHAERLGETVNFQERLGAVEVVLAHLPQDAVGFVELLLQMEGPGGEEEDGLVVAAGEIAAMSASLSSAACKPSGMITPSSQGVIQRRKARGGGMDNAKERWAALQSNHGSEAGKRGPQVVSALSYMLLGPVPHTGGQPTDRPLLTRRTIVPK